MYLKVWVVLNNSCLVITSRSILFVCNFDILQHSLLALTFTSDFCYNLQFFCRLRSLVVLHIYIWSIFSQFEALIFHTILELMFFLFSRSDIAIDICASEMRFHSSKNKSELRIIIELLQSIFLLQIWFSCALLFALFYLDLDKIHLLALRFIWLIKKQELSIIII